MLRIWGGEELTILLDDAAATANVSKSLRSEGHDIKGINSISEGIWKITVIKA